LTIIDLKTKARAFVHWKSIRFCSGKRAKWNW